MEPAAAVRAFLLCPTPDVWFAVAASQIDTLLLDHAHCEKKAASTALTLLFRYPDRADLVATLPALAREELLHFEQVSAQMGQRGIAHRHLSAARYAGGLHAAVRSADPQRLVDVLIIGAIIEARSCERFAGMVPVLEAQGEAELARFYASLLRSEARHFEDYLELARREAVGCIDARVAELLAVEQSLVLAPDVQFRFHSGVPQAH